MLVGDYRRCQWVARYEGSCGHEAIRLDRPISAAIDTVWVLQQIHNFPEVHCVPLFQA
jgi:hypothetical protein